MCGISGYAGADWDPRRIGSMVAVQHHRGPDEEGVWLDEEGCAALGHNRLRVLDLSEAGRQPMVSPDGGLRIVFNGEVYNYLELRPELPDHTFRTGTDTEVVLAAFRRWGAGCLERFVGMFAFAIWDEKERRLFAARDRFGVKPFYYHLAPGGTLTFASEIKALFAAGLPAAPDEETWAAYLSRGLYDHGEHTFWQGLRSLPPGHLLEWEEGRVRVRRWFDLADRVGDVDSRPEADVVAEYRALLEESVRLRFRADVPVGINLSGGVDSSALLGLVHAVQGDDSDVKSFTFVTGDPDYDELPWVKMMLERTRHPLVACALTADEVPALARSVAKHQDEPFGGLPTLAYARLFERARDEGVTVLLDGQGMDEQWAGYDYYRHAGDQDAFTYVQGARDRAVRPECLDPSFRSLARPFDALRPFGDPLRDLQYRDLRYTKIPRAMRFNDRVSMRVSRELREPFLDHRLVELALAQPAARKLQGERSKALLRRIARELAPAEVAEAPKRPVQTPQREWLRGPLRDWVREMVEEGLCGSAGAWLDAHATRAALDSYLAGEGDNSFFVWQWISLGLLAERTKSVCHE